MVSVFRSRFAVLATRAHCYACGAHALARARVHVATRRHARRYACAHAQRSLFIAVRAGCCMRLTPRLLAAASTSRRAAYRLKRSTPLNTPRHSLPRLLC